MAKCENCIHNLDKLCDTYRCENHSKFEPMTNAEKIKRMTEKELTDFLYDIATSNECVICGFKEGWLCGRKDNETCHDGVMKWLKSEVESE